MIIGRLFCALLLVFTMTSNCFGESRVLIFGDEVSSNLSQREVYFFHRHHSPERYFATLFCLPQSGTNEEISPCLSMLEIAEEAKIDEGKVAILDFGPRGGVLGMKIVEGKDLAGENFPLSEFEKRVEEALARFQEPGEFFGEIRLDPSLLKHPELQATLMKIKKEQFDLLEQEREFRRLEVSSGLFERLSLDVTGTSAVESGNSQRARKLREYLSQLVQSDSSQASHDTNPEEEPDEGALLQILEEGSDEDLSSLRAELIGLRRLRQAREQEQALPVPPPSLVEN